MIGWLTYVITGDNPMLGTPIPDCILKHRKLIAAITIPMLIGLMAFLLYTLIGVIK